MYDLEAELDILTTAYVHRIRAALRAFLLELGRVEAGVAASPPAFGPRTTLTSARPIPRVPFATLSPVSSRFRSSSFARAPLPTVGREKPEADESNAEAVLEKVVVLLTEAGSAMRSTDIRRSLSLARNEMQAAMKLGVERDLLERSGERFTTAYSLKAR